MFAIMESVIKTEDSKEYPLLSACRACLKPGDIPLFEANISENFIEFGGIKITKYDSLPKYLCDHCNLLLDAAILFRENVMNTDETLREYLCNTEWFSENEEHGHKLCAGSSPEYLTYETSDKINVNYKNDDSLTNDSMSCTKSEKEYLVIKDETDQESDLIMNNKNKNTANMSDEEQKEVEKDWFTCEMCHLQFKSVDELENHIELEHNINGTDKMNCAVCDSVISRAYYKVHLKLHREKFKQKKSKHTKVKCEICNKSLNSSYYPFHLKMHGSDTDKAARKRQCKICRKSVVLHYYNDHMKRVHKVGPNGEKLKESYYQKQKHIQCIVCDKYISEHKYKKHLANHGTPTQKYICDHCGKEFKYRSGFIVHLLTHGSNLKHKCKFCDYEAVHLGLLKVHVRIHTKDYNYKCTQCPARFTTKSNLSQHILRHKGPGHIKCYECDRMFHRKRNMEEHHKTIHLKIRDVICDICGKGFSHRDRMLSHQLKVHNRDRLPKQITAAYLKIKEKAIKDK